RHRDGRRRRDRQRQLPADGESRQRSADHHGHRQSDGERGHGDGGARLHDRRRRDAGGRADRHRHVVEHDARARGQHRPGRRTRTLDPAANPTRRSSDPVTVTDADGGTASDSFLLTVNPVNDLPTITDIVNQTVNEDTATAALAFTIGDVETPATALTVTAASSNLTLVPAANIVLGGASASRTVTVTQAANQSV